MRVGRRALYGRGSAGRGGAPRRPGVAARPCPRGRDRYRPRQSGAHAGGTVSRGGVQRDAARAGGALFHGRAAPAGRRAAAHRARRQARPHQPAGAGASLRSGGVPQRGDLLRPRDAGAPVHAVRRRPRAGRRAAARQGRDVVRSGARAPGARRAPRAHLSKGRCVTGPPAPAPAAPQETIVKVADWAAGRADAMLLTLGLGSCVAIMLHDPRACAGAMAHILLPSKSLARDAANPAKFPETAVPLLVQRLTALGADPRLLVAKLAGGASMFAQLMTPGSVQMGERNIVAVRDVLRRAGIPVTAEAVGGGAGRSGRFHVAGGPGESRAG